MQLWIDGTAIDQQIAEESICEECGGTMEYDARYEDAGEGEKPEYHAWAVCPNCRYEFEF